MLNIESSAATKNENNIMSVKYGVMMQEDKNNSGQGLGRGIHKKVLSMRRKILRLYLQYVNPKLAKIAEVISEPKIFVRKLLPENLGMWLAIAAALTGFFVLTMPEHLWSWQIILFLAIFLLGPMLCRFFQGVRSTFYNLLVAYPGKHLLNQEITLEQAIVDGSAEVTLHGENWELRGDDCQAGTHVCVIAIKENVLFVTPV